MSGKQGPIEPIFLDLTDNADYAVLTNALDDWGECLEHLAEKEDVRIRDNDLPASDSDAAYYREQAARARALRAEIDRQLVANVAARHSAGLAE